MPIKIVLIGATGSGKSTLGNLLLNPERVRNHEYGQEEQFPTGDGGQRVTVRPSALPVEVNGINEIVEIMDTPGLQENARADIVNVRELLVELRRLGRINAICYVYNGRQEQTFEDLTLFYKRLFPTDLLERNLVLVKTRAPEGGRQYPSAEVRRETNTRESQRVMNIMNLSTPPPIISLDSNPHYQDNQGWQVALSKRMSLLLTAASLEAIIIDELRVPKLQIMLDRDKMEAREIAAEIRRKGELKNTTSPEVRIMSQIIEEYRSRHTHQLEKIQQYETQLSIYDTDDIVNINSYTRSGFRGFGGTLTLTVDTRDNVPIICDQRGWHLEPFQRHIGDSVECTYLNRSSVTVEMKPDSIIGDTGGTLYARVFKRDKHAALVSQYKNELKACRQECSSLEHQIMAKTNESSELKNHYTEKLNTEIAVLEGQQAELLDTYISLQNLSNDQYVDKYFQDDIVNEPINN